MISSPTVSPDNWTTLLSIPSVCYWNHQALWVATTIWMWIVTLCTWALCVRQCDDVCNQKHCIHMLNNGTLCTFIQCFAHLLPPIIYRRLIIHSDHSWPSIIVFILTKINSWKHKAHSKQHTGDLGERLHSTFNGDKPKCLSWSSNQISYLSSKP